MIAVNETTNMNNFYVTNLLGGVLKSNTLTRSFHVACKVFEKTDHSTIARCINNWLK